MYARDNQCMHKVKGKRAGYLCQSPCNVIPEATTHYFSSQCYQVLILATPVGVNV